MALRSRIQTIKTHVKDDQDDRDNTPEVLPDEIQAGNLPLRGAVRPPAMQSDQIPDNVANPRPEAGNVDQAEEKKRKGRGPAIAKKTKALNPPHGNQTAPQLRARLKDLDTEIKNTRARHDQELKALRSDHRDLHDQLFDLNK